MTVLAKHNEQGEMRHAHIVEEPIIPRTHARLFLQMRKCGVRIANPTLIGEIIAVLTSPNADSMRNHLQDVDEVKHLEIAGTTTTTVQKGEATTTKLWDVEIDIPTTREPDTMDIGTTISLVNPQLSQDAICAEPFIREHASTRGQ
jgi:hypothetical protein